MTTRWHTTNEPIAGGTLLTDPASVAVALRLARTGWHVCVDARIGPGHVYAGPLHFVYAEPFASTELSVPAPRQIALIEWGGVEPVLTTSPGSYETLAQDIEFLERDGKAHLARLVADLRKRLFGDV